MVDRLVRGPSGEISHRTGSAVRPGSGAHPLLRSERGQPSDQGIAGAGQAVQDLAGPGFVIPLLCCVLIPVKRLKLRRILSQHPRDPLAVPDHDVGAMPGVLQRRPPARRRPATLRVVIGTGQQASHGRGKIAHRADDAFGPNCSLLEPAQLAPQHPANPIDPRASRPVEPWQAVTNGAALVLLVGEPGSVQVEAVLQPAAGCLVDGALLMQAGEFGVLGGDNVAAHLSLGEAARPR